MRGKSGGISAVTSDCFIHGTDSLYALVAMLFNAMLLHGTLPNDFLVSILIPIPKGSRVDVRKTQNYRAIALSNILGKIYNLVINQIMCSTLVIETIQYFTQMRSPVYVIFIDASKAFDRLSHIELLDILSEQNMCPLIRRLLFNLYGNQKFQVRWNNCLSNMYNMTNGVKQGAVLSPILLTMYIDGLFYELKRAGVGCHINGEYAGAFGYADDIVLLSPSLCALKHSITMCEDYAKRFKILFNRIKSKLMCFNVKHKDFVLYLCNQPVNLVEHETDLGNDIMLDSFSLHKLHSTYCMSLYSCEWFNYNSNYISQNCMWHGEK